jgi:hypothetical protein
MSGMSLGLAILATGVIAAFIIVATGPAVAAPVASPIIQSSWQYSLERPEAPLQHRGYIMVAAATVRDHRSNSGGSYNTSSTPPPGPPSPGYGEGGVGHSPWANPRDHRSCHTATFTINGQTHTGAICAPGN